MKRKQGIVFGVLIGIFVIAALIFWYYSPRWFENSEYPYYGHMIGGWGMPFGMLAMGLFWIAVIYVAFNGHSYHNDCRRDKANEALKIRLAKGEITIEEYEKLLEKMRDK